jgi:hypothetical protein
MVRALEVVTVVLVAIAMALSLAHALEFPGKLRLSREHYLAVQTIYYPGFTIGGVAEVAGLLALIVLALVTPKAGAAFWLTLGALVALAAAHAAYWLLTHPVNKFWVKDVKLAAAGAGFFAADPLGRGQASASTDWTALRDRWEYSHVLRATLAMLSLVLLVSAVAAA